MSPRKRLGPKYSGWHSKAALGGLGGGCSRTSRLLPEPELRAGRGAGLAFPEDIERGNGHRLGGGRDDGLGVGCPERTMKRRELQRIALDRVPFVFGNAAYPEDDALLAL